jgi:hypothetical protein
LEVEGTREDLPVIREALSQQVSGLLNPATDIAAGEVSEQTMLNVTPLPAPSSEVKKRARVRARASVSPGSNGSGNGKVAAIEWVHDSSKFGTPTQAWNTGEKSLWLLYVGNEVAATKEMSAKLIETTFNKHFRQSGQIYVSHINRDLGRLKLAKPNAPASVGENTTVTPSAWFLTEAGVKRALQLIGDVRGASS